VLSKVVGEEDFDFFVSEKVSSTPAADMMDTLTSTADIVEVS
jgi:hypothetical protein